MDFQQLPDFLAMCLLVGVLLAVQGRDRHGSIRLWTAALLLILLEGASRLLHSMETGTLIHRVTHIVSLEAYLFAGALFARSASTASRGMARSRWFLWCNILPHAVILAMYGGDVRRPAAYHAVVAGGFFLGVLTSIAFKRPRYYPAMFLLIWLPMSLCAQYGFLHFVPYYALFLLYLFAALGFMQSLPKRSRGMIAVSAGFAMWALSFLSHPWIVDFHPRWLAFAGSVWNLQKFIVTVGFLLVLLEQQIRDSEWLALHDELTGLPNRRLFDDRLQHALARAERDGQRAALFLLDLDGFKGVNDTLGHEAGDRLLRHVARNLEAATRRTDTLARIGGDEFALIAVDLGHAPGDAATGESPLHPIRFPQTQRIIESLLHAVEQPTLLGETFEQPETQVSASVGVAVFPDDCRDMTALIRLADQRMYQQKAERERTRSMEAKTKLTAMQTA